MNSMRVLVASVGLYTLTSCAHASSHRTPLHYDLLLPYQAPLCLQDDIAPEELIAPRIDHGIWSHEPLCVTGKSRKYCVHSTSDFRAGHGLSIIARTTVVEAVSSIFTASKEARTVSEEGLEVRAIPSKGKGLITNRFIRKGETILLDSPRIIASAQLSSYVSQPQGSSLLETAFQQLPHMDRQLVLSLAKSLGGSEVEDVLKSNTFACQIDDGEVGDGYMCLFPSVARINHACRPNAHGRFIPRTLLMEVKAVRDIKAGEEISISYGRIDLKHAERQRLYREGWNFTCTCDSCTASQYEIAGSDQRRTRFAQLRSQLENLSAESFDAQQVVAWEKEVMEISAKEGLDVLLAADYERLAYVYAGHGMVRDAKMWAKKARESLIDWTVVEGGLDNEIRRVEQLLGELAG